MRSAASGIPRNGEDAPGFDAGGGGREGSGGLPNACTYFVDCAGLTALERGTMKACLAAAIEPGRGAEVRGRPPEKERPVL